MTNDPFGMPAVIASDFASAESFRGRLVLIKPTRLELDVPNRDNPSQVADRLTCDVSTVDGLGPVQIFSNRVPTGRTLPGPSHSGVWFGQDRIVKAIVPNRHLVPGTMVLARIETYRPGQAAGKGNPWGLVAPTEADKDMARQFLASQMVGQAAAPAQQAPPAPAPQAAPAGVPAQAQQNPFANHPASAGYSDEPPF